jgi:DUF1680 family protein
MRLTASLQHYLATVAGDTLFVHLFAGSSLAGGELAVRVDTGYPWSGAAEIRVSSSTDPGWAGGARASPDPAARASC